MTLSQVTIEKEMKKYKINETKAKHTIYHSYFSLLPSVFSLLPPVQVNNASPYQTK